MDEQRAVTAAQIQDWIYERPTHNSKCLLLTVGGITVVGTWYGDPGQAFVAWAPMLRRDKAKEREIMKGMKRNDESGSVQ